MFSLLLAAALAASGPEPAAPPVQQPRFHGKQVQVSGVVPGSRMQLDQDFKYVLTQGMLKIRNAYSMKAGAYVSEFRDADGVYYRGPGRCVSAGRDGSPQTIVYEGGIYVPDDVAKAPLIYYYFNADHLAGPGEPGNQGPIVGAIVRNDVGKLFKWPSMKDEAAAGFIRSKVATDSGVAAAAALPGVQ